MTPAELMTACCDPHSAPAFKNDFWVITQEELERFHRRVQAQALREAADNFMADKRNFFAMTLFRMAEELENLK